LVIIEWYYFFAQQAFVQPSAQVFFLEQHDFVQLVPQVLPLEQQVFVLVFEQPPPVVAHELKDIAANAATDIIDRFWITFFIMSIFVFFSVDYSI
jgi:hypothetical protein